MEALILAIAIIGGACLLAAMGVIVTRHYVHRHVGEGHNDVLVPIFLNAGVIYAVLLGFLVIAVWENYGATKENASLEATTMGSLFRLADGMSPANATRVRQQIREYLKDVVEDEWPTLAHSS